MGGGNARAGGSSPIVNAKLSGLGTFVHRNDPELIVFVVGRAVEIFGGDRLMFGSNFPIEKLWTDHRTMTNTYRAAAASLSAKEQANIFWNTAERVYRPV